ncbi:MAG: hypothetical protein ACXWC9_07830, partial [Pseudobdellovibrionaceae bacterium]
MMQEVQLCFSYLIEKTKKLSSLNPTQKELILKELYCFLRQSTTNHDRRYRSDVLAAKWKEFEQKVLRTDVLQEPKGFFKVIHELTGIAISDLERDKEIAQYDKWEPHDFFESLLKEFDSKKSFFEAQEETIAYCGLKFLISEARAPKIRRDEKGILKV